MIIGECPYCDHINMTPIGPPGAWSKELCEGCSEFYWLKHSRLDPIAYKEDAVIVDKKNKTVSLAPKEMGDENEIQF